LRTFNPDIKKEELSGRDFYIGALRQTGRAYLWRFHSIMDVITYKTTPIFLHLMNF
jgi:hypothetical protein